MINQKCKITKRNFSLKKTLFLIIIVLYILGLITGSLYTFKNSCNLDYVRQLLSVTYNTKTSPEGKFTSYLTDVIFEVSFIVIIYLFKKSENMKSLTFAVPFVFSAGLSCRYISAFVKNTEIYSFVYCNAVKDAAIAFLIILYCYINIYDILAGKGRRGHKSEKQKLIVYVIGIIVINITDILIKRIFIFLI